MLHLEMLRHDRAVRITDMTTHWTKYIRANDREKLTVDTESGRIIVYASKLQAEAIVTMRLLASLPSCETVITDETIDQ